MRGFEEEDLKKNSPFYPLGLGPFYLFLLPAHAPRDEEIQRHFFVFFVFVFFSTKLPLRLVAI